MTFTGERIRHGFSARGIDNSKSFAVPPPNLRWLNHDDGSWEPVYPGHMDYKFGLDAAEVKRLCQTAAYYKASGHGMLPTFAYPPTQVGQVVKFREPMPDEDPNQLYTVTEHNGIRCFIRPINTNLPFPPIMSVPTGDMDVVDTTFSPPHITHPYKQILLTKEVAKQIPPLGSTESTPLAEKTIVAHFFSPYTNWDWYVVEGNWIDSNGRPVNDPSQASDYHFFGFVKGQVGEWSDFSLNELKSQTRMGGKLQLVERETGWEPTKAKDIDRIRKNSNGFGIVPFNRKYGFSNTTLKQECESQNALPLSDVKQFRKAISQSIADNRQRINDIDSGRDHFENQGLRKRFAKSSIQEGKVMLHFLDTYIEERESNGGQPIPCGLLLKAYQRPKVRPIS